MAARANARRKKGRSWLSHKSLIAVEAVLLAGVVKDLVSDWVKRSSLPGYGKVLFVMALTLGFFAGLLFVVERLTARGVVSTHKAVSALPWPLPRALVHAGMLFALFVAYARMLKIDVW